MKKVGFILFGIFILFFCASLASGAVLNVPSPYLTIQNAINNATSGDTINVSAGTYTENLVINKSVILQGAGSAFVTIIGQHMTRANDVTIDGFKFDGTIIIDDSGSVISGGTISNNLITGASYGIRVGYGTTGYGVDHITIENNVITANTNRGILFYNAGDYAAQRVSYITISNNNITNNSGSGISTYGPGPNTIINNIVNNNNGNGISVKYDDGDIIRGNNITNNTAMGINMHQVTNAIVEDNIVSDHVNGGVVTTFWGGSIIAGKGSAIYIHEDSQNNIIRSNDLNGNKIGVLINRESVGVDPSNNSINNNNIVGNTVYGIFNALVSPINPVNATYNWWGDCKGPGPVGPGGGDNVSTNVSYTPWLGACVKDKSIIPSCVLPTDSVTLYVNVSSLVCIGNIKFSVGRNGVWQNYTGTKTSGIGNYSVTISGLSEGENVSWTVYADDCYGHISKNGEESFYVNKRTNLTINPNLPDGLGNWYVTEPEFTLINPNANIIWYRWDGSNNIEYGGPFGLENISNPDPVTAGILELTWWSNLSCNRIEPEQNQMFYIDLTNPKVEIISPAENAVVTCNPKPIISAIINDVYGSNSGIDKNSIAMKINGIDVTSNITKTDISLIKVRVSYTPTFNLNNGTNIAEISGQDNAGNLFYKNWSFSINLGAGFELDVIMPESKNYSEKRLQFNIQTGNIVKKIEYNDSDYGRWKTLCTNCNSYNRKISFIEGWHNLTIKATDACGNSQEQNIILFIDSKKPKIHKTEPRRNSVINGSEFYIKYTEDNLQNITLFYGIGTESIAKFDCEAGKNKECIFSADLTGYEGQWIEYYFEVSDSINTVQSKKIIVFVDTISPALTINMPEDSADYGRKVPFNITIGEKVLLEYIDNSVASPRWRTLCARCSEYGNLRIKTQAFSRGEHDIQIRAVDKAGNSDVEERSFDVEY